MSIDKVKNLIDGTNVRALFSELYGAGEVGDQKKRYVALLDDFQKRFGFADVRIFSAPGRSEIGGNHTDHNHGKVLAASIQQDCIGAISPSDNNIVRVYDNTYNEDYDIDVTDTVPLEGETGSRALIRGIFDGFKKAGFNAGGFTACFSSDIIPASGVSSSAAFEMLICCALNNIYNGGKIPHERLASIGQYAENVYWKKASGLQDQMASAIGGLIAIDFGNSELPLVERVPFDFAASGYRLILVNTGGNHASLADEYSSIPIEMKRVAKIFGKDVLRGVTVDELAARLSVIRGECGDRAVLRAFHFVEENERVELQVESLKRNNFNDFLRLINESGNSSWKWLQNVYVSACCREEQNVSVCLALTELFIRKNNLSGKAACRVHGGGFAGVIQVFLPETVVDQYSKWMLKGLGLDVDDKDKKNICAMNIRPHGVIEITKE
jgi:galactokinase